MREKRSMMTSMAATVFDRQQALMKWQHLQQQSSSSYFSNNQLFAGYLGDDCSNKHNDVNGSQILACQANAWPDLAIGSYHVDEDMAHSGGVSSPTSSKRKSEVDGAAKMGIGPTEENMRVAKKARKDSMVDAETQIQQTSNEEGEGKSSKVILRKANSKEAAAQPEKTDYIHVRARRGQATDSHSLAERVRREKISERMKYLQDLVPGCNKITGKAGMLDEIINYVQSLQRQVEFLSMKLAAAHPRLDFSMDQLFNKEINPACSGSIPTIGMASEGGDPSYLQFNPMGDAMACCGLDTTINPSELALRRAVPVHDPSVDTSLNVHGSSLAWESEMQNLYNLEFHQGRGLPFPFQLFQGSMMPNTPKMEL